MKCMNSKLRARDHRKHAQVYKIQLYRDISNGRYNKIHYRKITIN